MSLTFRNIYEMWKDGHDTLDIAKMTGRSEPEILKEVSQCRSALRHLPYPYPPYHTPALVHTPAPMRRMGISKAQYRRPPQNVERDAQIIAAVSAGGSMENVADQFGLSKQRIWQIFRREIAA